MRSFELDEWVEKSFSHPTNLLDRAADMARVIFLNLFGVDDDGHIKYVPGAERSDSTIEIEFLGYTMLGGMTGWTHWFKFRARVTKTPEDEL